MNIDGIWLCPFVPAGCPGMGIVARAKRAFAHFIFSGTGKAGIEKIAGRQAKPGTGTPIPHHYFGHYMIDILKLLLLG